MPTVAVTVPPGIQPGDVFSVSTEASVFDVTCPAGVGVGDELHVEVPDVEAPDVEALDVSGASTSTADSALLERVSTHMDGDAHFVRTVEQFLADHCRKVGDPSELRLHELEPATREFPLEYQRLHRQYQQLVEGLLEELLTSIGTSPEAFVETLRRCGAEHKGTKGYALLKTLEAVGDLDDFLALLHEAKLEGGGILW